MFLRAHHTITTTTTTTTTFSPPPVLIFIFLFSFPTRVDETFTFFERCDPESIDLVFLWRCTLFILRQDKGVEKKKVS